MSPQPAAVLERHPAATGTLPWAAACAAFARRIGAGLAAYDPGVDWQVRVAPMGVRDELAAGPSEPVEPATGRLVPVHVDGRCAVIGPLTGPGGPASPCPRCLARRWQTVRPLREREALEFGGATRAAGELPLLTPFTADAVCALVAGHRDDGAFPAVYVLELATLSARRVRLAADPECPDCGTRAPDTAAGAVPDLPAVPKPGPRTFRGRALADYDLHLDALVNPVCGVLGRGTLHELDLTSTAAVTGYFLTRADDEHYEIYWGGHADSFADSLRIGVLEGLERSAGMQPRAKAVTVVAPYDSLNAALDPRTCGLYAPEFYDSWPGAVPFAPDRPIPWVWGWSLRDERPVLVPEVLTYYHSTVPEQRFVQECSNGCASGSSFTEAVYFGLLEVLERDAFLLAWYGRAALPEIDPATSERTGTRVMVDRLAMYGYRARFFDARVTFGVPIVTAVGERLDGGLGALCFGAGASLDPEAALAASLVEIATDAMRLRRRTERDEAELRGMAADFDQVLALHDHPRLYGLPEMARYADFLLGPRAKLSAVADLRGELSGDLREDLRRCVAEVTAKGFDVIVVDQTSPEQRRLGLHTASVIVPGLLPIDFGWCRQRALRMPRLRTARHEAGLSARALREDELNQAPHPFP